MLQVVATGAYYPPVATTLSILCSKLEFENHKNQYFSWLLRSERVKTNIFGNRMANSTFYDWSELVRFKATFT